MVVPTQPEGRNSELFWLHAKAGVPEYPAAQVKLEMQAAAVPVQILETTYAAPTVGGKTQ